MCPDRRSLPKVAYRKSKTLVFHPPPIAARRESVPMQKVRTRLVNFRVTDEEFEQLKSACDRQGARCLSDFARNSMLTNPTLDHESVVNKVVVLERRIASLETSMSRLHNALAGSDVEFSVSDK